MIWHDVDCAACKYTKGDKSQCLYQICTYSTAYQSLKNQNKKLIPMKASITVLGEQHFFNPLNTKRRLLYLKTHFLPRSKHFSSRL